MQKPLEEPDPAEIDEPVRPLIAALNAHPFFCTWGCCSGGPGHSHEAYIGLYVKGQFGLRSLQRLLNLINSDLDIYISCTLAWPDFHGYASMARWPSFELSFIDGQPSPAELTAITNVVSEYVA